MHQKSTVTANNRYPEIFSEVKRLHPKAKRILSFGCSTGEEILSLKNYFPDSYIEGVEINKMCIGTCIINGLNVILYDDFKTDRLRYDIIFAMSVLCRYDDTMKDEDATKHYSFNQFDHEIERFVSKLNLGGLLIVYNSNYMVTDSTAYFYKELESMPFDHESGFVPKYHKDREPLQSMYSETIFRKI